MERSLAYVVKIDSIQPIPDADFVETAYVKGWTVVVQKGQFKKGDFAIFYEIDSLLPIRPEYEFLRTSSYRNPEWTEEGYLIKTVKRRKQLSQGLLMPMDIVDIEPVEGLDLTEMLGIRKWDKPLPANLAGEVKGLFPNFLKKTDQERIQNCWGDVCFIDKKVIDIDGLHIRRRLWNLEEKLDGSSCQIYWNGELGVCSRNLELKLNDENFSSNAYVRTAFNNGYLKALAELKQRIAIQGELCGPGIQGNKYNLTEIQFYVFDVWLIEEKRHATQSEREMILYELIKLGVNVLQVPYLGCHYLPDTYSDTLALSIGKSALNPKQEREGVVFKCCDVVDGQVFSFKAISNKFLLEEK